MRTAYFSLENIPKRSDCERLLKEYKKGNKIGGGAFGSVYELCKETNCNFVLKTLEFNKSMFEFTGSPRLSYEYKFQNWKKEINNHLKVIECQKNYKIQIFPNIYDAWFCDEENGDSSFYIIIEKFEGDLKQFINRFSFYDKDVKSLLKGFIEIKFKDLEEALEYINNTCKICLDDIKLDNILYKKKDSGGYDLVFSDFGTSFYEKISETCIDTDKRRFSQSVREFIENFKV